MEDQARRLRLVVLAFLGLSLVAFALAVVGLDAAPALKIETRAPGGSLWWAAVALTPFAIALWRLAAMLGHVAHGQLFTPAVMTGFRGFAFWLMLSAVASLLVPVIAASVAVANAGGGNIPIIIDVRSLLFLIAAAVLFLVARMLEEAARIDAELKEIV